MTGYALGFLDWGVGGLGCYLRLRARFPETSVLYWSDAGSIPYGKLSREALRARVLAVLSAMVERGARQLVVACNAASTVLPLPALNVPCLDVIEAALATIPRSLRGTLAVLGGARTIRSGIYQRALTRPGLEVRGRVAQPLSAHIEAGNMHTRAFAADLAHVLAPVRRADAILWACTHYPAASAAFRAQRPDVRWFDPAETLVEHIAQRCTLDRAGTTHFVTTGDPEAMARAARAAWQLELPAVTRVTLATGHGHPARTAT